MGPYLSTVKLSDRHSAEEHTTDNRGVENKTASCRQSSNLSGPTNNPKLQRHAHLSERSIQRLIRRRIELGNAMLLQNLWNRQQAKVGRCEPGLQPPRVQRKRDRRTKGRSETVGRCDRLL